MEGIKFLSMFHQPTLFSSAPWTLTGEGTVFLYAFPDAFNQQYGFMEDYQRKGFKTGLGAVMLVSYKASGVGPYQELLYIPGIFQLCGKLTFSISKIYVSTHASAWNGRENWGIPKELADFSIMKQADGSLAYEVRKDEQTFFEARVKPWRPTFPINTNLIPGVRIVQQHHNQFLLTKLNMTGNAQLATTKTIQASSDYFPPLQQLKLLATLSIKDFLMVFPVAEVLS